MKKVVKILKIIGTVSVLVNGVLGFVNYRKAKQMEGQYDDVVTFGEKKLDMSGKGQASSVGVMFAASFIDYRKCPKLDQPYELTLYNRFSGVEIVVPEGWFVKESGKLAFAGMDNYTATFDDQEADIILKFDTAFSGVSIKNETYS